MSFKTNIELHHAAIVARNPAAVKVLAHLMINDRLYIVAQTNKGNYATWEISDDDCSHNGHYDIANFTDALDAMIQRARG